jgi:hypothetical protein
MRIIPIVAITVAMISGCSNTPVVEVSLPKVQLSRHDVTLYIGQKVIIPVAADGPISWTTSDSSVARADTTGLVTTRSPGFCYIVVFSTRMPTVRDSAKLDVVVQ